MIRDLLTRRAFARNVGGSLAMAAAAPALAPVKAATAASLPRRFSTDAPAVKIDANENPYGPSPRSRAAIADAAAQGGRYPFGAMRELVKRLAAQHGVEPEQVVLGCGSTEILRAADLAFLSPGKNVVVAEPTYEAVPTFAGVMQGDAKKIPLTADFRHDLPRMASACDGQTGLVYLCNPNNPTGTIVTREELGNFLARTPASTAVLLDEAYFHFVEDPAYASGLEWMGKAPNLIVARTFSKIYGLAGMRLGYAVGPEPMVRQLRRYVSVGMNTNIAVLQAATAGLDDSGLVERNRHLLNGTRQWLCTELARDGRRFIPSHTNFVMIDMGGDVTPTIEAFRKRGIAVGRKFPAMGNWLRVSIGTPAEMQTFVTALRNLA